MLGQESKSTRALSHCRPFSQAPQNGRRHRQYGASVDHLQSPTPKGIQLAEDIHNVRGRQKGVMAPPGTPGTSGTDLRLKEPIPGVSTDVW